MLLLLALGNITDADINDWPLSLFSKLLTFCGDILVGNFLLLLLLFDEIVIGILLLLLLFVLLLNDYIIESLKSWPWIKYICY